MPVYEYVAKDQTGKTVKSTLSAEGRQSALEQLRGRNLIVISLNEQASKESQEKKSPHAPSGRTSVKVEEVVMFSRQLATMVDAGVPILVILSILSQQGGNKKFAEVLNSIRNDIEVGVSLSNAFAKYPAIFPPLYVSMVKAGETSGMLYEVLDRLAIYLEKSSGLQKKIKSSLMYPAVVTTMALIITAVLLLKVVPIFKNIFSSFNAALPTPTVILMAISDGFRKYFFIVMLLLGIAGYLLGRYIKTDKGHLNFDRFILRLPVFGMLFTKVAISKFTRTLSTLVKSGVPILSCLETVAKTCGNKVFELAIDQVRSSVREGESIAVPLEKTKVFPIMVVRMIAVGEQTGQLEKMLGKIADFYDEEVDATVSGLTSLIEPLIIVFLGLVIGTIAICMFMPIFKLATIVNM